MRSKFLLVHVGVDGDKLSDYGRREMQVFEFGVIEEIPDRREVEEAAFELCSALVDGHPEEALVAVIPLEDATVLRVKISKRMEVQSQVGGAI